MANEITAQTNLNAAKNGARVQGAASMRISMTGDDLAQATQLIGTTSETLNLGEIVGAPAVLMIQNLDAANFVEIGGDSGLTVFKVKIPAQGYAVFQPTSGTIYAKADTAAVRIQIIAAEA